MDNKENNALSEQVAKEIMSDQTTREFIIRKGDALPVKEPVPVNIMAQIDAPARWLEKRVTEIDQKQSHVVVCREGFCVSLITDERSAYMDIVRGKLELSEEMNRLGINNGEYITAFEMADLIKTNRSCFESTTVAMKLVTELRNFKAKVDKEIEASDDKRGNRRILAAQVVESNLPSSFRIVIPVFKGQPKQPIEVEVEVNPADLSCTLVSPEANDIVRTERDSIIDGVLSRIEAVAPDIVVIEG